MPYVGLPFLRVPFPGVSKRSEDLRGNHTFEAVPPF